MQNISGSSVSTIETSLRAKPMKLAEPSSGGVHDFPTRDDCFAGSSFVFETLPQPQTTKTNAKMTDGRPLMDA
jgi:hypothetical protein